jgi:hypothetical protein
MLKILALLRQQSTHSAIVMAVIVVFLAQIVGVDVVALTGRANELLVALAGLSVAAKAVLPDTKPPAPPLISEAATRGLERLAAAMETREGPPA